jgi:hypothetical protein
LGEQDAKRTLLKCPQRRKWGEELLCSKWFSMEENVAYRKVLTRRSTQEVRNTGEYYLKWIKIIKMKSASIAFIGESE